MDEQFWRANGSLSFSRGHSRAGLRFFLLAAVFILPATSPILAQSAAPAGKVGFNRDIRPIMSNTCFKCHGPDKNARMMGLRLDIRDEALKKTADGVTPIVPGKPDDSAIIQRIFASDPAKRMPPLYSHKVLTEAQKNTIRQWVAEGAVYEGHWAYIPVIRPAVPEVTSKALVRNPIDAFIQARLATEGLQPSPDADRHTLIRRVTLDLTGLPPTAEEIAAFAADRSPNAYEKVVDRLMASPRYAEKQAVSWLDAVRYADTCGFHGDNVFPAWPYRDYVLRAFRDNKPFDAFTREQLAGDLLPNATVEQKVASAYNRLNRTSAEGGVQPKEYLAKYGADRVRTTSVVWLGSTLGCAECHDHKFDPFTSRDFYSMKAFFADIKETGLVPDQGPEAWGSQLALPTPEQSERLAKLQKELDAARQRLEKQASSLPSGPAWEQDLLRRFESGELSWRFQRPLTAQSVNGAKLTIYNNEMVDGTYDYNGSIVPEHKPGNGLVVASGPDPDNETYTITFKPGQGAWTALGIEVVHDAALPGDRLARAADRVELTEVDASVSEGKGQAKKLALALATTSTEPQPGLPAMATIDGNPRTGWGMATYAYGTNPFLSVRFAEKLKTDADSVITVRLHHDSEVRRATIGRFRVALSSAEYSWPGIFRMGIRDPDEKNTGLSPITAKALKEAPDKRSDEEKKALADYRRFAAPELEAQEIEVARLETAVNLLQAEIPHVVVSEATEPAVTRILPRANWMDETSPIVEPAVPAFLGKLETGGRRATRLDLANWIVSPGNPLTARVYVNRQWREFFGTGLSKILDDLGSQGEWPTHPELLDWLAAEFMQPEWQAEGTHAWDMKHLVRLIVTSHTYRQSSRGSGPAETRDPDNRLLARQNRFRVDAESVRDIALAASGLLVEKFGGPSVKPPQPDGYLATLNFPRREYAASHGQAEYRRGIYIQWQRTFLYPSLLTFDAPTREECTVNRTSSNTPLQALVLLNDPVFVEAARSMAEGMLTKGGRNLDAQLRWAFMRALSREPSGDEEKILDGLYAKSLAQFRASPASAKEFVSVGESPLPGKLDPVDLAAATTVARAILNLHETITRN